MRVNTWSVNVGLRIMIWFGGSNSFCSPIPWCSCEPPHIQVLTFRHLAFFFFVCFFYFNFGSFSCLFWSSIVWPALFTDNSHIRTHTHTEREGVGKTRAFVFQLTLRGLPSSLLNGVRNVEFVFVVRFYLEQALIGNITNRGRFGHVCHISVTGGSGRTPVSGA